MRCDKTEQAIARLENETYGYFEITGEPIDLKRLIAQPATSLSLATQETRERRVAEDLTTSEHVKSSAQPDYLGLAHVPEHGHRAIQDPG
jgi:RNA polymerase-binding transcription factor DksA